TFLISLKMAQFSLMKQIYGFPPILLLDDIFDRLDSSRVDALVKLVCSDIFGQIFITDSDSMRITSVVKQYTPQCSCIIVKNGIYSPIETEGNEAV
ncbi:MAG: DNA replication and repair protein RecF, partial [Bacteroidales bacterium]|nr:DNA replication and repair protein RecF [Bacteroidales bacterium]